jgi:ERCC4-type nuclease
MEGTLKVIVDNRERNAKLIEAMIEKGIEVEFKSINVGDYVLSDRVCVERKTVSDFESSIISGRLFEQVKRLKDSYEFPILVLEGDSDYFRLKSNVINGAIAALYIDYGIVVVHTYDAQNSGEIIASMAMHEQVDHKREPSLKGGRRSHSENQFQEYIIGNIPGIGPKLARSLLKNFGSIRNISNAKIEDLLNVEKIGKKKAELIHSILSRDYKTE